MLAATRSIDKIAITSFGSAFGALSSAIGSVVARAAKAETSTLFFFLEVTIQMITKTRRITTHAIDAYKNADQPGSDIPGKLKRKSYHANYFCPLYTFYFLLNSTNFPFFADNLCLTIFYESISPSEM